MVAGLIFGGHGFGLRHGLMPGVVFIEGPFGDGHHVGRCGATGVALLDLGEDLVEERGLVGRFGLEVGGELGRKIASVGMGELGDYEVIVSGG